MRSTRLGLIFTAVVSTVACGGQFGSDGTSSGTSSGGSSSGGTSSGGTSSGGPSTSSSSGGSSSGLTPVSPGFTPVERVDVLAHFAGVVLTGFDGAVLRQAYSHNDVVPPTCSVDTPDARNTKETTIGDPCLSAVNRPACANALACLYSATGFEVEGGFQVQTHYYFVFGFGGTLTTVTTRPDLITRLGSIDSPAKAMVLASLEAKFRAYVVGYRAADGGGWDVQMHGGGECTGSPEFDSVVHIATDGTPSEVTRTVSTKPLGGCAEGRRPVGLVDCPRGGLERGLADYLAEAAHLEAAAVFAFEEMARTLRAFGAPDRLVRAAEAARRDEKRHARTMSKLARDFGGEPRPVHIEPGGAIDLEALALVNAVEGCVRETYAVARALWQSKHAAEPRIRAAYAVIARDETRHAELSWALAEFLETKLDVDARARVEAARRGALEDLRYELHAVPHPDVTRLAGLPDVATGIRLFDELFSRLALTEAA